MRVWSKRVYGIPPEQVVGEREYAYDARPPSTGRLVGALEEAARRGWIVVDTRRDWAKVFDSDDE